MAAPSHRTASNADFSGVISHKIGVVLYRLREGHPEILAEQTLHVAGSKGRFKLPQGDRDLSQDNFGQGHNAYRLMAKGRYGLTEDQVSLMEINPKEFKRDITEKSVIADKGFQITATYWAKMRLLDSAHPLEREGSPFVWLTSIDVINFEQPFRNYAEILHPFGFQIPA